MTTPHRATPAEWKSVSDRASLVSSDSCILELCARVEALERRPHDKLDRLIAQDAEARTYLATSDGPAVPDGREPASVAAQPSRADLEALFRQWWALSYPTPPGVHAVNTHVGFGEWLLAGGKP